jgi:hypothetical protein
MEPGEAEMTALMERPPPDDPASDVQRADAVAQLIGQRLGEAELAVIEARDELSGLALLAEIDASVAKKRDAVRARLREAESRLGELTAAQVAAADLSREARARALLAHRAADWVKAGEALDEALTTGRALDSLLQQAGDLHAQLKRQLGQAATLVSPHLARAEYNVPVPNLKEPLLLVLSNAGGPPVDPRMTLHMEPAEVARASVVAVVGRHTEMVLRFRPATEEDHDHGD